jgi:hypothetical protein
LSTIRPPTASITATGTCPANLSDRAVLAGHSVIHSDDKTLIRKQFRIFCDCHHIRPVQPPVSQTPLKSDSALDGDQEMTMTTHMRMLSSLALTAAALITLSSDALARGGMGGGGGMRSFHVARAPTVVSKVRTTSTAAAIRSRTTSATSHTKSSGTKTSHAKANHCKKGCDSSSDSKTNPGGNSNSGSQDKDKSAEARHHHRHHHDKDPSNWMPPTPASAGVDASQAAAGQVAGGQVAGGQVAGNQVTGSQVTAGQGSGGTVRKRRNVEDRDQRDGSSSPADGDTKDNANPNSANPNPEQDGNGTRPPQQAPAQELIGNYPVAVVDQGGGGGTNSTGSGGTHQIRTYPIEAPTVSTGNGAAPAPVAVDPPGCFYERSVRKPAGGGLQRVILKICPDA